MARLSNYRSHHSAGAPSFAYLAKGGYHDGIRTGGVPPVEEGATGGSPISRFGQDEPAS